MTKSTRRDFLQIAGATGAISALSLAGCAQMGKGSGARVVVIGGGYAGATAAKYVKTWDSSIDVTLIEPKQKYVSCPLSNTVLGGFGDMAKITFDYTAMKNDHKVNVVHDMATAVDPAKKTVTTKGGQSIAYDRLIVAPGIDFNDFPGYVASQHEDMVPHAWKAGPQTVLLRKQLEAMDDGGVVIISPPTNPYRCPPGPYERASLIGFYLKTKKPRSKVIVMDPKDKFSKQGLFTEGWNMHYKGYIEWVSKANDGAVLEVDAKGKRVRTDFGWHKADVLNFIPPKQKAGGIAAAAGLTDKSGWCPVNLQTFESTIHKDIHVIGDAAIVPGMPKSGNAGNTEAKACALAVVSLLNGDPVSTAHTSNTCYSLITPSHGMSVNATYHLTEDSKKYTKMKGSGGLSPMGASADVRKQEAKYAWGWLANISTDIWG